MTTKTSTSAVRKVQKPRRRPLHAIYVHGLASGASSQTFLNIQKRFPQFAWGVADFGEDIEKNVKILNRFIARLQPSLIIGSSMGGLTVLYADAPDAVKIVCNPALSIADCVRNTIGLGVHKYFCRRINGAREFELTEQMCCDYEEYIASHTPSLGKANYAIFAAHDELLGDDAAAQARQTLAACNYTIIEDPNGAHRTTPSTLDLIEQCIAENHLTKR
ncbi:MAG: hypothetical protein IJX65_06960 [Alistipes sp.]|nr:hypothetical protein [Alistipes sp.]